MGDSELSVAAKRAFGGGYGASPALEVSSYAANNVPCLYPEVGSATVTERLHAYTTVLHPNNLQSLLNVNNNLPFSEDSKKSS